MISLTRSQTALVHAIITLQSQGRKPTVSNLMEVLNHRSRGSVSLLRKRLNERLGVGALDGLVPRDARGRPLRFIPVTALPQPERDV